MAACCGEIVRASLQSPSFFYYFQSQYGMNIFCFIHLPYFYEAKSFISLHMSKEKIEQNKTQRKSETYASASALRATYKWLRVNKKCTEDVK